MSQLSNVSLRVRPPEISRYTIPRLLCFYPGIEMRFYARHTSTCTVTACPCNSTRFHVPRKEMQLKARHNLYRFCYRFLCLAWISYPSKIMLVGWPISYRSRREHTLEKGTIQVETVFLFNFCYEIYGLTLLMIFRNVPQPVVSYSEYVPKRGVLLANCSTNFEQLIVKVLSISLHSQEFGNSLRGVWKLFQSLSEERRLWWRRWIVTYVMFTMEWKKSHKHIVVLLVLYSDMIQ
jgi:hypothetical protein